LSGVFDCGDQPESAVKASGSRICNFEATGEFKKVNGGSGFKSLSVSGHNRTSPASGATTGVAAVQLTIGVLAGWAICFWPARWLRGDDGVFWMSVAAFCCLVPGWIVVFISRLGIFTDNLVVSLIQMSVRLVCVVGAAVVVKSGWPQLRAGDFFGWLVGFYVMTMLLEVILLHPGAFQKSLSQVIRNQR
jgi:hypothetical protein